MGGVTTVIVRPGVVEYVDLCQYRDRSREEFFADCEPKLMRVYGLIFKTPHSIKVLLEDDIDANEECEGITIPNGCVRQIIYFKEDHVDPEFSEIDPDLPNDSSDVN